MDLYRSLLRSSNSVINLDHRPLRNITVRPITPSLSHTWTTPVGIQYLQLTAVWIKPQHNLRIIKVPNLSLSIFILCLFLTYVPTSLCLHYIRIVLTNVYSELLTNKINSICIIFIIIVSFIDLSSSVSEDHSILT